MTTAKTPAARYSTKEIAARLFLSEQRTRHFLFAAGVAVTKCGTSYLWDGAAADRVIETLRPRED